MYVFPVSMFHVVNYIFLPYLQNLEMHVNQSKMDNNFELIKKSQYWAIGPIGLSKQINNDRLNT
jgi:hypothetical protein